MGPRTSEVTRSRVVRRRGLDERAPHVKSVARRCAPMASSPRILTRRITGTVQTLRAIARKSRRLSQVIFAPRAQASRRCETQATLSGKPPSSASVSVP